MKTDTVDSSLMGSLVGCMASCCSLAQKAGGSVVAGGLGDYGSDLSENEEEHSAQASESSDTDEEELHHRIREKIDAFRRKERELQERQAQEAQHARGEGTKCNINKQW